MDTLRTRTLSDMFARQFYNPSLRVLMHAVGLHGPHAALTKPYPYEQPKVLIDPRRRGILLRSSIHFLPICTTIVIAWLNLSKRFVGYNFKNFVKVWNVPDIPQIVGDDRYDAVKLASLLLVAKLYELLVVGSLSAIIFHQIRHEIVFGDGVPFGLLGGGLSFGQLSYLWTREYWAAASVRGKSWRLSFLVVFISLCTVLVSLIGAMSAVLIAPRFGRHPAGGTSFWVMGNETTLFPDVLEGQLPCLSEGLNPGANPFCPGYGYKIVLDTMGRYVKSLPTVESELGLGFDVAEKWDFITRRFSVPISKLASTEGTQVIGPHLALAQAGGDVAEVHFSSLMLNETAGATYRYRYGHDPTWKFTAKAPAVQVKCVPRRISNISQPVEFIWSEPSTPKDRAVTQGWIFSAAIERGYKLNRPFGLWLPPSGSSSIGVFINRGSTVNSTPAPDFLEGYACAIDAWWSTAEYTISRLAPIHVTCSHSPQHCFSRASPRISLLPSWMQSLSPTFSLRGKRTTALDELLGIFFVPTFGHCSPPDASDDTQCGVLLEVAFAAMVADGVSRSGVSAYNLNLLVDGFEKQFADRGAAFRLANSSDVPLEFIDSSFAGLTHPPATSFTADVAVQGYGYDCSSVTRRVALGFLFAYCLMVIGHVMYQLVCCGWSSEAWDSIPEMLALAVGSEGRDMALRDAGVGIAKLETLRKRVTVGARKGVVGLVFEGEADEMGTVATLGGKKAEGIISTQEVGNRMERVVRGERYS